MRNVARHSRVLWHGLERRAKVLIRLVRRWLARGRRRKDVEPRLLRIREQIGIGEKRTVAILECGQQSYLIACTSQSVSLLAKLPPRRDFTDCLADHFEMVKLQ